MSGPRRIVVLDGVPREHWNVDTRCAVIWRKRLWFVNETRCAICIRKGEDTITFVTTDPVPVHRCADHGDLAIFPFIVKRAFVVTIGSAVAEGEHVFESRIFIPQEISFTEYNSLLQTLLAEAELYESSRIAT